MTTPDVAHRLELTVDLPGSPEQVWAAIATGDGNSAWFLPTDLDEREGGAITVHMGEDMASRGTVTGWEPPRRFEISEPEWAAFTGHPGAPVTPLVTEYLVEAQSGGTCRLTVVSSAFGTGADWEGEFFTDMEQVWAPYFQNLRLYLTHFAGQTVTPLVVEAGLPGSLEAVWSALKDAAGIAEVGQDLALHGLAGRVERLTDPPDGGMIALLDGPLPGMLVLHVWDKGDDEVSANVQGYLFAPGAAAYVERMAPAWRRWLDSLAVGAR
jgi:uncharacterized protein YndB with AHSA1/START domain